MIKEIRIYPFYAYSTLLTSFSSSVAYVVDYYSPETPINLLLLIAF